MGLGLPRFLFAWDREGAAGCSAIGASINRDGIGAIGAGRCGGSSMMRRESIQVGGLCSRIDSVTTHRDDGVMLNDRHHMRPNQQQLKRSKP